MAWRMWQRSRWFVGVLLSALAWHNSCALQGAVVILKRFSLECMAHLNEKHLRVKEN
jgi:hypothetical protein